MAIFLSDLMKNGGLTLRNTHEGVACKTTARIRIPAGTVLTDGDLIKVARLPANAVVTQMLIRSDDLDGGGSPALDMDLGWGKALADPGAAVSSANAEVSGGAVAGGETEDPDYYVNGGTLFQSAQVSRYELGQAGLANEFTVNDVRGLDGIADIQFEVITTANATHSASADAYIDVEIHHIQASADLGSLSYDYDAAY